MLEKVQELPEVIVNNIYKFLRHPIADMFNEFIDKYNIEYVKDMDLIKFHNMNYQGYDQFYNDDDIRMYGYYNYNMFPIMYFSIKRGEWDIANGYIGDCDRRNFSYIYLINNEWRDLKTDFLFSLIYTDWDNNITKITFRWERSRTNIYKKSGLKYIYDNNDGSITVSAGLLSDSEDDDVKVNHLIIVKRLLNGFIVRTQCMLL
jgi:hypothetical protein